ncbi:DUF6339 family protein [Amycolatopsis rubida]|uniref:Uncharacterized protein n=1 Tax=Amycolatopsis rubida TaxID=112413 RepID=A0A1I5W8M7_9PSEU|nr:DUF6339 family protein [Amycolatopsis rubida]SFQ16082.1 hypothetical protein SAMN05421854_109111 [Amycolatopsis rubida]
MTSTVIVEPPATLGLLSNAAVAAHLGRGIQSGDEVPPRAALQKTATALPVSARWQTEPFRELVDEAMRRFHDRRTAADAWLAPRLHATLRMSRSEAAQGELWNFIALLVAPDYVVWRHRGKSIAQASRFSGPHYTQAFARLWWAAELFRNGEDYRPAEAACQVQEIFNSTMRLDVIDHRPTAVAIVRLLERMRDEQTPRLGDHLHALSAAINIAGSTLVFEALAPDSGPDPEGTEAWISSAESAAQVPWDRLPDGPDDGYVAEASIQALLPLFQRLQKDANVRVRKKKEDDDA